MKKQTIITLMLLPLLFAACASSEKGSDEAPQSFKTLSFVRTGGGDIAFSLAPTDMPTRCVPW